MHSDQNFPPQKPMIPLADQVGGGYIHNAPTASFGRTVIPPCAKHMAPFHNIDLQPSDVCPRNFIIFDQTDNRSQIMFHPAIAPKFCYPGLNVGAPYFQDNAKRNDEKFFSSTLKEDSDDIDALLSFEEEEEECDEEEVSTARTHGNYDSDSLDSCSTHGVKPRKSRLHSSLWNSTGSGSRCNESKRQKMRKMVKTLRRIVPGGNQMSTGDVLDEAVRYLKSLKVEVEKLGV